MKARIVLCCFLLLFVNQGLTATSFNVFQTYIVTVPGVGDVGGSVVLTVRTFVSLVAIFFVGGFYKRVSLRAGATLAMLFTAAGFFIYGMANDLVMFCIGSIFTGIGYGFGGMVAMTMIIGNWFRGHIGTMVGIAGMGTGVASMVMPVVAAAVIEATSLSTAFMLEGALALVFAGVVVALLRSKPEDVGMSVQEERDAYADRRGRKVVMGTTTIGTHDKRLMVACIFMVGAICIVGNSYFSVLLTSSGVALGTAAALTAVMGLALTVSKFATGWVFDLIGTKRGSIIFFAIYFVGLVLCFLVSVGGAVDAFFAAVFLGAGIAVGNTGVSIWALELSSPSQRLKLVRDFQVAFAFGGFAFTMLPGVLANFSGSYGITYLIFAVASVACLALVLRVYKDRGRA